MSDMKLFRCYGEGCHDLMVYESEDAAISDTKNCHNYRYCDASEVSYVESKDGARFKVLLVPEYPVEEEAESDV